MKISINKNDRKLLTLEVYLFSKKKVLSIEEFTKLGSYLGKPRKINYLKCHKNTNLLISLKEVKKKKENFFGDIWHSDHAFEINPPRYTVLLCKKISSIGNLTYFINRNELFRKLGKKKTKISLEKNYFKIDAPLNFKKNASKKYNKKIRQSIKGASKNNYGYKINISPYHNSFFLIIKMGQDLKIFLNYSNHNIKLNGKKI